MLKTIQLNFINRLLSQPDVKRLIRNTMAMGFVQASNYLLPLITFPYLVRTLGLSGFGVLSMLLFIMGYFDGILTYDLSLSGAYNISKADGNKRKISAYFHDTLALKAFLSVISLSILVTLTFVIPQLQGLRLMVEVGVIYFLANCLQFDWFFQGIQEMKNITFLNILSRFLNLVLLFTLVKSPNNLDWALMITPLSQIGAGLVGLYLIYGRFGLPFVAPNLFQVAERLWNGASIFASQIMVRFYSSDFNVPILGFLTDSVTVGIYAVAYRVYYLLAALCGPILLAAYPYLSNLYSKDFNRYVLQTRKLGLFLAILFPIIALMLFIAAPYIVRFVAGANYHHESIAVLRILCLSLTCWCLNPYFTHILVITQRSKYLIQLAVLYVIINIFSIYPLILLFGVYGVAINTVLMSILCAVLPYWVIKRSKILEMPQVEPIRPTEVTVDLQTV